MPANDHRLVALLIVSAFIVAGGIHYQTPMLAAIAAEFGANAAATGWIPACAFGGIISPVEPEQARGLVCGHGATSREDEDHGANDHGQRRAA